MDGKGLMFDEDSWSEREFNQRSHSPETHPKQGISSSPKENQSVAIHILKNSLSINFMKKVHKSPQPTIQ
jgi:hypothetical protein